MIRLKCNIAVAARWLNIIPEYIEVTSLWVPKQMSQRSHHHHHHYDTWINMVSAH